MSPYYYVCENLVDRLITDGRYNYGGSNSQHQSIHVFAGILEQRMIFRGLFDV